MIRLNESLPGLTQVRLRFIRISSFIVGLTTLDSVHLIELLRLYPLHLDLTLQCFFSRWLNVSGNAKHSVHSIDILAFQLTKSQTDEQQTAPMNAAARAMFLTLNFEEHR